MLGEVTHLRGTPTCRREGLGKAGAKRLAAEGEWVFLPPRRAGWHMGSSLVPPRDPQAQEDNLADAETKYLVFEVWRRLMAESNNLPHAEQ